MAETKITMLTEIDRYRRMGVKLAVPNVSIHSPIEEITICYKTAKYDYGELIRQDKLYQIATMAKMALDHIDPDWCEKAIQEFEKARVRSKNTTTEINVDKP